MTASGFHEVKKVSMILLGTLLLGVKVFSADDNIGKNVWDGYLCKKITASGPFDLVPIEEVEKGSCGPLPQEDYEKVTTAYADLGREDNANAASDALVCLRDLTIEKSGNVESLKFSIQSLDRLKSRPNDLGLIQHILSTCELLKTRLSSRGLKGFELAQKIERVFFNKISGDIANEETIETYLKSLVHPRLNCESHKGALLLVVGFGYGASGGYQLCSARDGRRWLGLSFGIGGGWGLLGSVGSVDQRFCSQGQPNSAVNLVGMPFAALSTQKAHPVEGGGNQESDDQHVIRDYFELLPLAPLDCNGNRLPEKLPASTLGFAYIESLKFDLTLFSLPTDKKELLNHFLSL